MHPRLLASGLADTLAEVARITASATRPWWVIGSAAMVLHGLDVPVADVDLMLAVNDADRVLRDHGRLLPVDGGSDRFRSGVFGQVRSGPLTTDVMGGFHVRQDGRWVEVQPATRVAVSLPGGTIFVPSKAELARLTRSLGVPSQGEVSRLTSPGGTSYGSGSSRQRHHD